MTGRKHAEIVARVEWAAAALALAEKTGDIVLIQKAAAIALAANTALHEMNAIAIGEIGRALDLVRMLKKNKSQVCRTLPPQSGEKTCWR